MGDSPGRSDRERERENTESGARWTVHDSTLKVLRGEIRQAGRELSGIPILLDINWEKNWCQRSYVGGESVPLLCSTARRRILLHFKRVHGRRGRRRMEVQRKPRQVSVLLLSAAGGVSWGIFSGAKSLQCYSRCNGRDEKGILRLKSAKHTFFGT